MSRWRPAIWRRPAAAALKAALIQVYRNLDALEREVDARRP